MSLLTLLSGNGSGSSLVRSVKDYGARGDGTTNDTAAILRALAACQIGDTLFFPVGNYAVNQTITTSVERVTLYMDGYLVPYGSFSDYLLNINRTIPSVIADYSNGTNAQQIRIDGRWKARGIKCWRIDEGFLQDILILRPYGTAMKFEGIRETTFNGIRVVSGLHRQVYSNPSAYSSATTYGVGDIVRMDYSSWAVGSTYAVNDMVKGSDGIAYRSLTASNLGNDPTTDDVNWVWEPWLDFKAVIANTNFDPLTYNTNNATSGNRYWKRVYQDEAALDLNQEEITSDGSNSVFFYGTVIRNSDYKTLVRIDCNANDQIVRNIQFIGSHFHCNEDLYVTADNGATVAAGAATGPLVRDYTTIIDIQRAWRIDFDHGLIRAGRSILRCIGVRIGCNQAEKQASYISVSEVDFSGEGVGQIALARNPNAPNIGRSHYPGCSFRLTGTGARKAVGDNFDAPYNNIRHIVGTGTPEGVVNAPIGTVYSNDAGDGLTSFYVRVFSGSGNTGWRNMFSSYLNNGTGASTPNFTAEQAGLGNVIFQFIRSVLSAQAYTMGIKGADNCFYLGAGNNIWTSNVGLKMDATGKVTLPQLLTLTTTPTYADDTAAGVGGLAAGQVYRTSTGQLMSKL